MSASATDSITVAGRIVNIADGGSRTLIVNECDVSDRSVRAFADLGPDGDFSVRIPFSYGHTFTVNYGGVFVNAFAEPGDSIYMEIDASKSPVEFHLGGDHARMNEQYSHAFMDLSTVYRDIKLLPDTCALDEYMAVFVGEVQRKGKTVEDYISDHSLSDDVAEMLLIDNVFIIANQANGYSGRNQEEKYAFFTNPIFRLSDERNARVMIFPYHLRSLCLHFPEYIEKEPKGIIRDLMYASVSDEIVPARSEFSNPVYYDRLYAAQTGGDIDIASIQSGKIIVMDKDTVVGLEKENPLEWLSNRFSGQPVYLDFSATWCGLCRASLMESENLREYLRDSGVAFAVVWLKSDRESWAKFAPSIHNAVQIFVDDEDMSNRLMGTLNIGGFPSCYLMDRKGNLISEGVPRYLSPDLPDYLRRALE